ncbi:hypothetical protein EVAR_53543_1 [Eumeta japonica]|uniref:Uncharacterized protein n=1 Tax=Eumeta variegata TaxID=151549 RepID=A0A4C1Y8J1_EUMVA|nr:hypothetical protein EVAR_53543_1 [Eumeta japonica]
MNYCVLSAGKPTGSIPQHRFREPRGLSTVLHDSFSTILNKIIFFSIAILTSPALDQPALQKKIKADYGEEDSEALSVANCIQDESKTGHTVRVLMEHSYHQSIAPAENQCHSPGSGIMLSENRFSSLESINRVTV